LAQLLDVPPEALWERIPGVTEVDIQRWKQMAGDRDALGDLNQLLGNPPPGAEGTPVPDAEETLDVDGGS
jgi:ABC-type protease/lipase transport system fused ATPase/permease subunit